VGDPKGANTKASEEVYPYFGGFLFIAPIKSGLSLDGARELTDSYALFVLLMIWPKGYASP
jgi:hypothetical protein